MFLGAWEGHHRSLAKAVSWRLAGSLDTLILSYLITRNFLLAGSIASAETITKIVLYYAHERAWTLVPWGKSLHAYRSLRKLHMRFRIRIVRRIVAAAGFAGGLRHLLNPARLGVIGSFLLCFVIVMSPPRFRFQPSATTGSSLPVGRNDFAANPAEASGLGTKQTAVLELSSGSDLSLEKVESTQWPAGAPLEEEQLRVEMAKRNLLNRDQAKEVQQRLVQLGYLSVSATGMWGPLSRKALRAFKADHELAADETWDEATERSLFSSSMERAEPFVGIWGVDATACSPRRNRKGFLPAVIDGDGAWAGETSCTFESKQYTAAGWSVVARCSNGHDRWTANVRLIINGDQLTWTSERGSQSYLRCQRGLGVARAL